MEKISSKQAVELFSKPKKTFKTLDKIFDKSSCEFLVKAEEQGVYSLYTSDNYDSAICSCDDVYKTFCGLLYFEYGVGKKDVKPAWANYNGAIEDNWQVIVNQLEDVASPVQSLNNALDKGATLYFQTENTNHSSTFAITNPYNENFACKSFVTTNTFTDSLMEINSIANLCLSSCEQSQ